MPRPGQRTPLPQRIRALVVILTTGCWEWQGARFDDGYGRIEIREGIGRGARKDRPAHRVAYEVLIGPVPGGLQLDHLCRNKACVNPQHLEPVTPRTNTLRGIGPSAINAQKTHCHKGHPLADDNLRIRVNGTRSCRTCARETGRVYERERRVRTQPGSKGSKS